ncbi:MAG: J domain-containing protein [Planctomycetes bacterium]|nr:J domain-containing protein [Planctomycetota bacterium]
MSKQRDYYQVLGVSRTATDGEIKAAYRALARKWHPDVNKASDAAEKFNEIQQAYDILSDKEKRQAYDRFGHVGVEGGGGAGGRQYRWSSGGGPGGGGGGFSGFEGGEDLGSIFEQLFGGGGLGGSGRGGQRRGSSAGYKTRPTQGRDLEHTITVTFLTAVHGGVEKLRVHNGGREQSIDLTIPAGIEDGKKLRLRGKGAPSDSSSGQAGDLIIKVQVGKHPYYRREGRNILMDVPISITEAALGASIIVPTLKGEVTIKVPPGTSSGRKLRVPGHGIKPPDNPAGDFLAVIQIAAPTDLDDQGQAALEDLADKIKNPRTGSPPWA